MTALRRGGRGLRLRSGSQCPSSEGAAGGLRPRAAVAAHRRRGPRAGGRRLPAGVRFWGGVGARRRRCAAVVAACACVRVCSALRPKRWAGSARCQLLPRSGDAGGQCPLPAAAALGRRGLCRRGGGLPAGVRFWGGVGARGRRCAAVVAACACARVRSARRPKGRQQMEVPRNLRFLGGCGQSPP